MILLQTIGTTCNLPSGTLSSSLCVDMCVTNHNRFSTRHGQNGHRLLCVYNTHTHTYGRWMGKVYIGDVLCHQWNSKKNEISTAVGWRQPKKRQHRTQHTCLFIILHSQFKRHTNRNANKCVRVCTAFIQNDILQHNVSNENRTTVRRVDIINK